MKKECPFCGEIIDADLNECPICCEILNDVKETHLHEVVVNIPKCPNCNCEIKILAKFCPNCGCHLEGLVGNTKENNLNRGQICPFCGESIDANLDVCPICCEKIAFENTVVKKTESSNTQKQVIEHNKSGNNVFNKNISLQRENNKKNKISNSKRITYMKRTFYSKLSDSSFLLVGLVFTILLVAFSLIVYLLSFAIHY